MVTEELAAHKVVGQVGNKDDGICELLYPSTLCTSVSQSILAPCPAKSHSSMKSASPRSWCQVLHHHLGSPEIESGAAIKKREAGIHGFAPFHHKRNGFSTTWANTSISSSLPRIKPLLARGVFFEVLHQRFEHQRSRINVQNVGGLILLFCFPPRHPGV